MVRNLLLIFLMGLWACAALAGPYLDQPPPGAHPALFAPGVVSTALNERDTAITPDGKEVYWSVNVRNFDISVILFTRQTDSGWTRPEVAPFSRNPAHSYLEPAISPDGSRFFFVVSGSRGEDSDIWVMDRTADGWSEPRKLDGPVNSPLREFFPSVTRDGTLYFTREEPAAGTEAIYRSRLIDGRYSAPERLPQNVNCGKSQFNAFIAPDESFIIVPVWGREDSLGSVDYYVVFRNDADEWSQPINLGPEINTPGGKEYTPYVSPDGKYFFFMSTRSPSAPDAPPNGISREYLDRIQRQAENGNSDIYWIDAAVISKLKPRGF